MKIQEAIKILKMEMLGDSEQMEYAKQMAIKALEKQIPKKPILKEYGVLVPYPFCSWCDNPLIDTLNDSWHKEKFCHECGQKIDWSDLEE